MYTGNSNRCQLDDLRKSHDDNIIISGDLVSYGGHYFQNIECCFQYLRGCKQHSNAVLDHLVRLPVSVPSKRSERAMNEK